MTTGEKIKYLREHNGVTQKELAASLNQTFPECNFTRQVIANWETDRDKPKVDEAKAMVMFFRITLDDLFFDHRSVIKKNNLRKAS